MHAGWKVKWASIVTTSHSQSLAMPQILGYEALQKQSYGEGRNGKRRC